MVANSVVMVTISVVMVTISVVMVTISVVMVMIGVVVVTLVLERNFLFETTRSCQHGNSNSVVLVTPKCCPGNTLKCCPGNTKVLP